MRVNNRTVPAAQPNRSACAAGSTTRLGVTVTWTSVLPSLRG